MQQLEQSKPRLVSLYQLSSEYERAYYELVSNFDIPDEAINDTLEGLKAPLEEKCTNVGLFIKNLDNLVDGFKQAEAEMEKRRKSLQNKIARIKDYLKLHMEKNALSVIPNSPYVYISIKNNPCAVFIEDGAQIPEEYIITKIEKSPNKKALKNALESGKVIEGVSLKKGTSLTIK